MKSKRLFLIFAVGLAAALLWLAGTARAAQEPPQGAEGVQVLYGQAFTYQGQLSDAGGPLNGSCDLRFKLWNAASSGTQIGSTLTFTAVELQDGLFTSRLDFGAGAHDGSARWLEVAVRCPTAVGNYVTLTPRQELTGTPAAQALVLPFMAEANLGGPLAWLKTIYVGSPFF